MQCPVCHLEIPSGSSICNRCGSDISDSGAVHLQASATTLPFELLKLKTEEVVADKYKIIKQIGTGGMGVVFKAEDVRLKRYVALKFLRPEYLMDPEAKRRFLVEAQAAASIDHPNICPVYEINESMGQTFIVMPFIDGESLKDRIARSPLSLAEVLGLFDEIGSGLSEAHKKGIVHRDIKSANIMVNKDGQVRIMDFGLAKLMEGAEITASIKIIGTLSYMSPEQARGSPLDHRTDIWSLGVMLFEVLTNRFPFEAKQPQAKLFSICHEQPRSIRSLRADLPRELEAIVERCLQKEPDNRYPTVLDLLKDLKLVEDRLQDQKKKSTLIAQSPLGQKKRRNVILIGAFCTVLLVAGVLVVGWPQRIFKKITSNSAKTVLF